MGRSRLATTKYGAHTRKQSLASKPGKQVLGDLIGLGSLRESVFLPWQQITYQVLLAAQDAAC